VAIPLAALAGLFAKPKDRTAAEVAGYLKAFIEGTGSDWDWDAFESVPIKNPALEAIRQEAAMAGPPNPSIPKLKTLLARAEALRA
jgi:hypothetical protein